jgi:hypothetical protein
MKRRSVAVTFLILWTAAAGDAQRLEPLRAISGEMSGAKITGKLVRLGRQLDFSMVLTKAEMVSGQLQLHGTLAIGATKSDVKAKVAGAMARITNPWPSANDQPRRPQRTEQTQSLYSQQEGVEGCGVLFLNFDPGRQLRARMGAGERVQLGVVLEPIDNRSGEEINTLICRLVVSPENGSAALSELNRLLATAK